MSTIKEQYFTNLEKQMLKTLQHGMYEFLDLDEEAIEEMNAFLKEQGFVGEVFTNSYKLLFEEEMLDQMMEQSVKFEAFMEKCHEACNTTPEYLESRVSQSMERFFEDFREPLFSIVEKSAHRQTKE